MRFEFFDQFRSAGVELVQESLRAFLLDRLQMLDSERRARCAKHGKTTRPDEVASGEGILHCLCVLLWRCRTRRESVRLSSLRKYLAFLKPNLGMPKYLDRFYLASRAVSRKDAYGTSLASLPVQ